MSYSNERLPDKLSFNHFVKMNTTKIEKKVRHGFKKVVASQKGIGWKEYNIVKLKSLVAK